MNSILGWKIYSLQYRCGGARGDVEERNPVLGALWDGVVLRQRVEGLQVDQHLICLVYTGETESELV